MTISSCSLGHCYFWTLISLCRLFQMYPWLINNLIEILNLATTLNFNFVSEEKDSNSITNLSRKHCNWKTED